MGRSHLRYEQMESVVMDIDGVVRGVTLLHKGHYIRRPLTLICPLEIKAVEAVQPEQSQKETQQLRPISTRKAAETAHERIRLTADAD